MTKTRSTMLIASLSLMLLISSSAAAQSTAFTYQGKLANSGNPATGNYDMQFKLFDALTGGNQIGSTVDNPNTLVTNGIFTVELDFAAGAFDGTPRYLEICVRPTDSNDPYTVLAPRQSFTSIPYAMHSANAAAADGLSPACAGCVTDAHIETVDGAKLTGNVAGSQISGEIPAASIPIGSDNYIQNSVAAARAGKLAPQAGGFNIGGDGIIGSNLVVSGEAAIGIDIPTNGQLHVVSGSVGKPAIYGESDSSRGVWGKSVGSRGVYGESTNGEGVYGISTNASGVHGIANNASGVGGYFQNNAIGGTALLVDGSGNILFTGTGSVGIGTATPLAGVRLDVRGGSARVEPGNGGAISFGAPNAETGMLMQHIIGSNRADVRFDGSTLKLVAGGPAGAPPSTNGIAINTAGSVGIGTTNPTSRLQIEGTDGIAATIKSTNGRAILALDSNTSAGGRRVWTLESGIFGTSSNFAIFDQTAGRKRIEIDSAGKVAVNVLQIDNGLDLAEHFEVAGEAKPGMLVAIDPQNVGKFAIARGAYNRRVAGVISGANNLSAGMVLAASSTKNSKPVALSGRTWVYCDATKHAILPGDLLTTSTIPGHAMKVRNYAKAQGAIIGKAMTALKGGRGLVLVLVSLQ